MKSKEEKAVANRRDFLKLAGLGAAAGGVALVSTNDAVEAAEPAAKSTGYRETEHVRTYYKLARF